MVHEHMHRWAHLVPAIMAVMELVDPILTELLQLVNSDELSRIVGLKQSFKTNRYKIRNMDNLSQNEWIMECSFDYRTIVHLWMDIQLITFFVKFGLKRYVKCHIFVLLRA